MTWRNRSGALAAVVIVGATLWRAVLVASSYFNQDDFYLSARAYAADLNLAFLTQDTAGHVNPMQQLTYWLVARAAPYDWPVVATFIVGMHLVGAILMWHVLTRLLPGRWVRIPLLVVFVSSPLTLATSLWWSAAMGLWPHVLMSLTAVLFLLRADQNAGRGWVNVLGCLAAVVMGLLWHERAVLIAPTLFGVAVVLADDHRGWRRLTAALRRHKPLWGSLALLLPAYLVTHSLLATVEGGGSQVGQALRISWSFVVENVVTGLASGPWVADLQGGAVQPHAWVSVTSVFVALGLAVLLVRRGGPSAWWALVFLAGYVVADLALVLGGRGGFGRVIGLDPRYSSDVVHVAVLAAALGLRGSPRHFGLAFERAVTWTRVRTIALTIGTAAYLVGAAFGTAQLVPHFQNQADREYVTNFRADLAADPTVTLVDDLLPAEVVLPLVGEDSTLSRVFAPLPEAPPFDQPSPRLRRADETGRLLPLVLAGAIPMKPGPVEDCGYAVRTAPMRVELLVDLAAAFVMRVGYFTDTESTVEVSAGPWQTQFLARTGPNEIWIPVPAEAGDVDAITFSAAPGVVVCVASLEAGLPVASEE